MKSPIFYFDSQKFVPMMDILKMNNHENAKIHYLKMDVEGSEINGNCIVVLSVAKRHFFCDQYMPCESWNPLTYTIKIKDWNCIANTIQIPTVLLRDF